MRDIEPLDRLENVAACLRAQGQAELAQQVSAAVAEMRREPPPSPPDFLTTGEAASLLGVRSLNTIKRWVLDGLLEGYRRGGRVLVTRASVERLASSPTLAQQRAWEQRVDAALAPFDADDEPLPDSGNAASGGKPWDQAVASRS